MMKKLFLAAVLLPFSAQAQNLPQTLPQTLPQRLDSVVDDAVARQAIVGGVLLVAKDGDIVYHRAFGYADREAEKPMREDTVFRLASMTKPIVTATALALVEEGRLSLEDPVTRYLPDFRPRLADGKAPPITIHQLLTHTSGISSPVSERKDPAYSRYGIDSGLGNAGLSLEENLQRIAKAPLRFKPGTGWWYGSGTDVLGAVIERASGLSLPEAVASRVTQPLRMDATRFVSPASALATPYGDGTPPFRMEDGATVRGIAYSPSRALSDKSYASGAAGLNGTAGDYLKFLEALRTGGEPILLPDTARAMLQNQTGDLPIGLMGKGWGWAQAFAVLKDPVAAKSPAHAGTVQWGGVYGSHFWLDPQAGLSVVLLTNTALAGTVGAFPDAIRAEVYR